MLLIAQPPLSQQIRQLERELGAVLLIRSTRNVELTPAGRTYLKRVVEILDAVDDAAAQARRVADGLEGHLTIGCVGSATYSLLPELARALRQTLLGLDVSVRGEMLAPAQLSALASGDIDLALLRPPVPASGVTTHKIRRDRLLVARARRGLDVVRLKGGDPFVFGRGSEEVAACRAARIRCEVIPGISSALAGPAAAGIPVTARGVARAFAVVTARHAGGETDPAPFVGIDTQVLLMGRAGLARFAEGLIAAGRHPDTPAACVQSAHA